VSAKIHKAIHDMCHELEKDPDLRAELVEALRPEIEKLIEQKKK